MKSKIITCFVIGSFAMALADCQGPQSDSASRDIRYTAAYHLDAAGDTARARNLLSEMSRDAATAPAERERAATLGAAIEGRRAQAEKCIADTRLEMRVTMYPNAVAKAWFQQGVCLEVLGRNADALAAYSTAIAMRPALAVSRTRRALLYAALGEGRNATEDLAAALALRPVYHPAALVALFFRAESGDCDGARQARGLLAEKADWSATADYALARYCGGDYEKK